MVRKLSVLFIAIYICSLFSMKWLGSFEEGVKQGAKQEKPVLFLFMNPKQKESLELSYIISKGHLDCFYDKFIMVQLNISKPKNAEKLKSLKMNKTPVFVLQDFDPKRKLTVKTQFVQPPQIFNALFDIYSTIGNEFMKLGDTTAARNTFDLISGIPNKMGAQAENAVKQIDQMNKNNKTVSKKNKLKDAKTYFDKASVSIKNGNFDKAYLYLQKTIEIDPKSKIAKKAKLEMEKISPKVDKSKFLKKKDNKGS